MSENIDDEIMAVLEQANEPLKESDIIDAVAPRPKNQASYALVILRLQSLSRKGEIYSPTPEREWSDL